MFWAARPVSKATGLLPLTTIAITSGAPEQVGRCVDGLRNLVDQPAVR